MTPIAVLVVDGSAGLRRLLRRALSGHGLIGMVTAIGDRRHLSSALGRARPDVVVLDLDPGPSDGFATLRAIRTTFPNIPLILIGKPPMDVKRFAVDGIMLRDNDYVAKPLALDVGAPGVVEAENEIARKISAHILAPREAGARESSVALERRSAPGRTATSARVQVIVVGASTGGPEALRTVSCSLPQGLAAPVVIAQHMPPVFTRMLAERLSVLSCLEFREIEEGRDLFDSKGWIAPGNFHARFRRDGASIVFQLSQDERVNFARPSVDVLFASAAATFGARTLAVMLSGMGQDGLEGCRAVRAAGGSVICQDEQTSPAWSMPGSVVAAGLADATLPVGALGAEILRRVGSIPEHRGP